MQTNILAKTPLFFVRSGNVHISGFLNNSGNYAYYWSSTAHTDTNYAYYLAFDADTNVDPSYWGSRYLGFSVRCLAQ